MLQADKQRMCMRKYENKFVCVDKRVLHADALKCVLKLLKSAFNAHLSIISTKGG